MDNELFNEALERIELLNDELNKVKRAIIAASEGKPFNEAFNDEVFLENKQDEESCESHLARIFEHLLKLKYCTNERNHRLWVNSYRVHKNDLTDLIKWKSKKRQKTNYINHLNEELQNVYEDGIAYYKDAAREYSDLVDGLELIPEKCPWTLEEVMEELLNDLLKKLPDKK